MASQYDLPYTGNQVETLLGKVSELEAAMPEKVSDLQNDAGYITDADIPTDVSDFNNDAGYITNAPVTAETQRAQQAEGALGGRITAVEGKIPSAATTSNKLVTDADIANFITKSVNDLANYYLKSETYTKTEVNGLIGAIDQFHYEIYASISAITSPASNVLYLIGPTGSGSDKYEEYVYSGGNFVKIGDTTIDLSGYVTTTALNTALANYTTTADLTTLLAAKYEKPSGGIPKTDLDSSVQTSLGKADSALQQHQDISGKADIADLQSGDLVVKLAENLEPWESRDNLTVEDTWDDMVQTTAGDVSVVTSEGARLVGIKAKTNFSANSLVATGFNLLHRATAVGTGFYFLVPKLEFGTFGTALKPNGVLFTDKDGVKMTPTVRFKALADGVPTTVNDGAACSYMDSNGYRFYTTPGVGYMIVSGITFADTCAHIGWSRRYDEYISPSNASDAGSAIALSTIINAIHAWGEMLVIGDSADEVEWTSLTSAKWTRRTDRVAPTWTTVQNEGDTYTHTTTIGTMKSGGTAILDGNLLAVDGYTVSYTDTNESASSSYVYFELAAPVTGTVTLDNGLTIEDWGLVYLAGASGSAYVTMRYAQGYPDALATLVDARLDAEVGKLNEEIEVNDSRIRVLEALDLSMYDYSGVRLMLRNTANCYVVRTAGSYKIPLVYGNGIKDGQTNAAAYTRQGTTYTADFVNHLGNQLSSPFIEANAGCSVGSVGLLWQTDKGDITEVNLVDGTDCRYLQFTVGQIPATNGVAVVYVKDKNGDTMWSWMLWLTTDNLEPLTFTNHTEVEYDLMPEALGTIWNAERT